MKKINDADLLEMLNDGLSQREIASRFQMSEPAVSMRVKRLRQQAGRPAILDQLTGKERSFVAAIVEGKTQTQAALDAFDVTTRDSAKSLGCRLMKDPEINEAITAVMNSEGLTRRSLVKKLRSHLDAPDSNVSLRAVDMGLKLHDAYPAHKSVNMDIRIDCPVDLSRYRLPDPPIEVKPLPDAEAE
jgi:predicted transcriptional regulator